MAVKWIEGFEIDYQNFLYKYPVWNGNHPGLNSGRLGGRSYRSAQASGTLVEFTTENLGDKATRIVGMAIFPLVLSSEQKIFVFQDDAAEQISVWMLPGSGGKTKFRVKRGSTTLGTTAAEWTNGFWLYLEVKHVCDTDGTDGSVELHVNEGTALTISGADTTDAGVGGTTNCIMFRLITDSQAWRMDDVYVCDDADGINDDFLGDRCVEAHFTESNGDTIEWTPNAGSNFNRLSEEVLDGDTSFNSIANNQDGKIDLFNISDITTITTEVNAVQITFAARMDSSGDDNFRAKFKNGSAVTADGPDHFVDSIAGYQWFREIYNLDPTTAAAWTVAGFNAMQIGYESRP